MRAWWCLLPHHDAGTFVCLSMALLLPQALALLRGMMGVLAVEVADTTKETHFKGWFKSQINYGKLSA